MDRPDRSVLTRVLLAALVPTVLVITVVVLAGCAPAEGDGTAPPSPSAGSAPSDPGRGPTSGTTAPATPATRTSPAAPPSPASPVPPSAPPPPAPTRAEPDADRAVRLATVLSRDVGARPAGSRADAVGRLTVAAWLRAAGWEVEEEPVALPQGGSTANVVARWGGRGHDERHVVIGAHLDTVAGSPGANDNASGVGAVVALAAELADEAGSLPVPVVLVAFGAEEFQPSTPRAHHLGSEIYAATHGEHVVAMLSVDMVGHGPATCICWLDLGPAALAERLAALAPEEAYRVERRGDISDHGPFARRGIPAAFLWTYGDGRLHTPADTPEHLQAGAVARATRLTAAFVRSLTAEDLTGLAPAP